jgi:hypothetical protein
MLSTQINKTIISWLHQLILNSNYLCLNKQHHEAVSTLNVFYDITLTLDETPEEQLR